MPMDLASQKSELEKNYCGVTEKIAVNQFLSGNVRILGPNCNENDVYSMAFKVRMVPSDSMEESVQKKTGCTWI